MNCQALFIFCIICIVFIENPNTVYMHKYFKIICPLLCVSLFFSCSAKNQAENNFNAYLPPSFEDYFDNYALPIESKSNTETDVWDVSDIDISYIDSAKKLIAFTFDDSPAKYMENILVAFASFNEQNPDCRATATFFINGGMIFEESYPLLHTAHILGFELGNHTHSHFDLTTLNTGELQAEIRRTDELLSKVDGKNRHLLRPPFGRINEEIKTSLQTPIINWTIDTLDWTGVTEQEIFDSVFNARFSGAIVLMHDGPTATVQALKKLLPALKEDGYQVVSVSALAKAHGCILRNGKEYIRARKQ